MHVVFQLQGAKYAIDAAHTLEMMHGARVTVAALPGAHPSLLGVFDARGLRLPLIDLRSTLGVRTLADEVGELRQLLDARERDHVAWLTELERCAHTGDAFTKPTDPTKCAFGRWYAELRADPAALGALTGDRLAQQALFQSWDAPHRAIHALADRVLAAARAGDTDTAVTFLQTGATSLASLRASFAEFVTLFSDQRQAMIVVCQAGPRKVALAVDDVAAVEHFDTTRISDLPALAHSEGALLTGVYRRDDGGLVYLLDPERVALTVLGAPARLSA